MTINKILLTLSFIGLCMSSRYSLMEDNELFAEGLENLLLDPKATEEDCGRQLNIEMQYLFNVQQDNAEEASNLENALNFSLFYDIKSLAGPKYEQAQTLQDGTKITFDDIQTAWDAAWETIKQDYKNQGAAALNTLFTTIKEKAALDRLFRIGYYTQNSKQNVQLQLDHNSLNKFRTQCTQSINQHLQSLRSNVSEANDFVQFVNETFNPMTNSFYTNQLYDKATHDLYITYLTNRLNILVFFTNTTIPLINKNLDSIDLTDEGNVENIVTKIVRIASVLRENSEYFGNNNVKSLLGQYLIAFVNTHKSGEQMIANGQNVESNEMRLNLAKIGGLRVLNLVKDLLDDREFTRSLQMYLKLYVNRPGNDRVYKVLLNAFSLDENYLIQNKSEDNDVEVLKRNLDLLQISLGKYIVKKDNVPRITEAFETIVSNDVGYFYRAVLGDTNYMIAAQLIDNSNASLFKSLYESISEVVDNEETTQENFADNLDDLLTQKLNTYRDILGIEANKKEVIQANLIVEKILNWIRGVQSDNLLIKEKIVFPELWRSAFDIAMDHQQIFAILNNLYIGKMNLEATKDNLFEYFNNQELDVNDMRGLVTFQVVQQEGIKSSFNFGEGKKPLNFKFTTYSTGKNTNLDLIQQKSKVSDLRDIEEDLQSPKVFNNQGTPSLLDNGVLDQSFNRSSIASNQQRDFDELEGSPNRISEDMMDLENNKNRNIVNVIKGELTTEEYENLEQPDLIARLKKGEKISGSDNVEIIYVQIVEKNSDCYDAILNLKNQLEKKK